MDFKSGSKAQVPIVLIIHVVLFVVAILIILLLTSTAAAKLGAVEDKLFDTADSLGIVSCEDLGEVSYAEFMRALNEIQVQCDAAGIKCSQLKTCKKMTIKFPTAYDSNCVKVDQGVISTHGLSEFETPNVPRIICENQDTNIKSSPISTFFVSYSSYDSKTPQCYMVPVNKDSKEIMTTLGYGAEVISTVVPIIGLTGNIIWDVTSPFTEDGKYVYARNFKIPDGAKIRVSVSESGGFLNEFTYMKFKIKISGGESYKDSDCMGDLAALDGMCESDGCNVKTHMQCYDNKYIIQTKEQYCKLETGYCGNEEIAANTGYCSESS